MRPEEHKRAPQGTVTIAPDFGGYWRVMRGDVALMTGLDSETQARRWAESNGWEVVP